VLTPWIQIPQGGKVVSKVMEPAVAMPILLALIALLGLSLLDEPPRKVVRRVIDRVARRDPRVDELDDELAAVGVDVDRLRGMSHLDLQLYSLGIDMVDIYVIDLDQESDRDLFHDHDPVLDGALDEGAPPPLDHAAPPGDRAPSLTG
jgi:hypothetical protein